MIPPLALPCLLAAAPPLPETPKKPVIDRYFGTKVTDDYRWLEDDKDPAVQAWSAAQNAHARAMLDALPGRPALEKRIAELLGFEAPSWSDITVRNHVIFASKQAPPKPQPLLVVLATLDSPAGERVLLDPSLVDPTGETTVDFWEPSPDGKHVAVSLSRKGTERGDVHVYETATGKELEGDVVPAVNSGTAGGSLAWFTGGFYYTRHPLEGERATSELGFHQQVYAHRLFTPASADRYEIGKEFPRIAESFLTTSHDGAWAADLVQNGDGGEFELFVRSPDGSWTRMAGYPDKVVGARFGRDGALYLLSRKDAPNGRVLRLPLVARQHQLADSTVLVAEGDGGIEEILPTRTRLYLTEKAGGPCRVRIVALDGKPLGEVPAPPETSLSRPTALGDGDDVLVDVAGYLKPTTPSVFAAVDGTLKATALGQRSPADLAGYEVVHETCTSKDGTKVPLSIVRRKGTGQDGTGALLLYGYGGFGISLEPRFMRDLPAWLELGGQYAEVHIRGGGEFGETWHRQGMLGNKQNGFDDFLAAAEFLVERKHVAPHRLAIKGGSNGGLLMGAALTQAPRSFAAVVAAVGYYDMLRYETAPNGQFNTTEYGSVHDEAAFRWLSAYSPYHHVRPNTPYPAALFLTGANDPRVAPFHSRKMTAALQASDTRQPVLLRTSDTGHGRGTPLAERISQTTDGWAFLAAKLGVPNAAAD